MEFLKADLLNTLIQKGNGLLINLEIHHYVGHPPAPLLNLIGARMGHDEMIAPLYQFLHTLGVIGGSGFNLICWMVTAVF